MRQWIRTETGKKAGWKRKNVTHPVDSFRPQRPLSYKRTRFVLKGHNYTRGGSAAVQVQKLWWYSDSFGLGGITLPFNETCEIHKERTVSVFAWQNQLCIHNSHLLAKWSPFHFPEAHVIGHSTSKISFLLYSGRMWLADVGRGCILLGVVGVNGVCFSTEPNVIAETCG